MTKCTFPDLFVGGNRVSHFPIMDFDETPGIDAQSLPGHVPAIGSLRKHNFDTTGTDDWDRRLGPTTGTDDWDRRLGPTGQGWRRLGPTIGTDSS